MNKKEAKRVMKKVVSILMILALTAAALVGCSAKTSSAPTTTTTTTTATEAPAPAETKVKFKLGWAETAERTGHPLSQAAYTFKEEVEKLSNGSIEVDLYPAAQLGDASSMLTQVEAGTLESCMSISNGQFATSYYPDLGFLDIPYLFENAEEAYKLLQPEGDFFKGLQSDIATKTGIRPLVFFNEGLRHITNSKLEITKPEDLKGIKIRTMNVAAHMKMFEILGAQPTNISWNELYTALQTGVADAQENPVINAVYISAWEVQKYMTLDGHVCLCGLFCMNEKFYQSLSDVQKDAVNKAAKAALEAEYGMFKENESKALQTLKDNGLQVTELTSEQKKAFADACQAEVIEFLKSQMNTPDLIDTVLKIVEEGRK